MLTFLGLCLLSRIAYTFNDVLVGELARKHDGLEISMFRGLSLGVTMAPVLIWVPARAWAELSQRDRRTLHLVEVEGLSYEEVGKILSVGRSNLKMIVFRSRRRIARHIRLAMGRAVSRFERAAS